MASMAVRMARPIAVPRPVRRVSIAASSSFLSVVGRTSRPVTPEKVTRPILDPSSCASMKSRAACCAAVSRLGATSVEHIEPDTSIASRIVAWFDGTSTDASGRAAPVARTTRPAANSQTGMRRRHSDRPGSAARTSATVDRRTASRRRRRRIHQRKASSDGKANNAVRAHGQCRDIYRIRPNQLIMSSPPAVSSSTATATAAPVSSVNSRLVVIRRSSAS